jgi:hypothetical protein
MAYSDAASSLFQSLILQMLLDDAALADSLLIPLLPAAVISSHLIKQVLETTKKGQKQVENRALALETAKQSFVPGLPDKARSLLLILSTFLPLNINLNSS